MCRGGWIGRAVVDWEGGGEKGGWQWVGRATASREGGEGRVHGVEGREGGSL